jgi:hypothetical protein
MEAFLNLCKLLGSYPSSLICGSISHQYNMLNKLDLLQCSNIWFRWVRLAMTSGNWVPKWSVLYDTHSIRVASVALHTGLSCLLSEIVYTSTSIAAGSSHNRLACLRLEHNRQFVNDFTLHRLQQAAIATMACSPCYCIKSSPPSIGWPVNCELTLI